MTRKTLLPALIAALSLACCVPASANVLPFKAAKQAAKRLAAKQVRTRQLVFVHVLKAVRVGPREIKFAYDDRSVANLYCTSLIVVKLKAATSRVATARFDRRATVCRAVPDDALAYEAATRAAVNAASSQAAIVKSSLAALKQSSVPCRRLRVPTRRRAEVALFERSAATTALYGPIDSQLQAFVNALGSVRSSDGVLIAGASGWADLLEVYRSLPGFQPTLCAAIKRWAAAGWRADMAPADYAALKALDLRARRDGKAILRASVHLAKLGVFPHTAVAFTPEGLVTAAVGG